MSESQNSEENPASVQNMPIKILAQYVKDSSFENPNAPESLKANKSPPSMEININMDARKIDDDGIKNLYEVTLTLSATAKNSDKVAFIAEVEYGTTAQIDDDVAEEHIHPILLIEIPRIAFPFARNIIADMTQQGGYPPLLLNPVDFNALYMQKFGNEEKQKVGNA